MYGPFPFKGTVFLEFQPLGHSFFILGGGVISPFALCAGEGYYF
jgi:hypothetical protein